LGIFWETGFQKKMARQITSNKLDTRTARRSLKRFKDYWQPIERGRALKYRKSQNGGSWSARFYSLVDNHRREKKLGEADDTSDNDGVKILDYGQALQKANEFFLSEQTRATGESPHGSKYTIADALRDYLKALADRNPPAPDYRGAVYDFNRNTIPELGHIDITRITTKEIEKWRGKLAARPRLSTRKKQKTPQSDSPPVMSEEEKRRRRCTADRSVRRLVAALNYAVSNIPGVNANPLHWKIKKFKNSEVARSEYLSESEQREFVEACGDEVDFQNFVLAALHTGARLSELARLCVRDFNAAQKTIRVEQSKSGDSRYVRLEADAVDFFVPLIRNRAHDELLFTRKSGLPNSASRRSWDKDAVKLPMRRACKKADIRHIGFHQLRHSFATRLLMRGVSMKLVAEQLGHTSIRMLDKYYGKIVDAHAQQVIADLPSAGLNQAAKSKSATVIALPSRQRRA
jgi:integrase